MEKRGSLALEVARLELKKWGREKKIHSALTVITVGD